MPNEDQDISKDASTSYLVADGASWYNKMISEAIETKTISSSMDKVAATLHAFMLELGFINLATDIVQIIVPDGWKTPAGYVSKYKYPSKPEPPIVLNVTSMGQILKVHGTNLSTKETFSSSIKVSIFVRKEDDKDPSIKLGALSTKFKNDVGVPLQNAVRSELGLPINGLMGLPPEVLINVLRNLDLQSLTKVSLVNSQLNSLYKEKSIWKKLFLKDFGFRCIERKISIDKSENWYQFYKDEYLIKKQYTSIREESRPRLPMFPYPNLSSDPGPPGGPMVPGIVGGDYDRFPGGMGIGPGPNLRLPRPRFDPPGPNFPQFPPGRRGGGSFGGGLGGGFGGGFGGFM